MIYRLVMHWLGAEEETTVRDPADCSSLIRTCVLNNDLSAGEWIAGEVYGDGELLYRLAFNGRKME